MLRAGTTTREPKKSRPSNYSLEVQELGPRVLRTGARRPFEAHKWECFHIYISGDELGFVPQKLHLNGPEYGKMEVPLVITS